jgi:GDPmannose 4,6-dehydratase
MPAALFKQLGYTRDEFKNVLIELYTDGFSQRQIADKLNCHTTCIENWFKQLEISSRSLVDAAENLHTKQITLSEHQKSIIDGLLLSDGHINRLKYGARLTFGFKHYEAVDSLIKVLEPMVFCPVWFSKKTSCWHTKSHSYSNLTRTHERWYKDGIKKVPKNLILNRSCCYWWYIGDGCVGNYQLVLSTDGFEKDCVLYLSELLKKEGIKNSVLSSNRIRVFSKSIDAFFGLVGPSFHKCFNYKWRPRIHKKSGKWIPSKIEETMLKTTPISIVTGALGQTGSYMCEHLLEQGHIVYGTYRRVSTGANLDNIEEAQKNKRFSLVEADLTDYQLMNKLILSTQPQYFFNFAAQSHVHYSFKMPALTFRVNAEAVIAQLDAIRNFSPHTKYYQASTSELFGGLNCPESGYTEDSPFHPRSPYAVAKLAAFSSVVNYREAYGLFACNGILHNHESPRRGLDFAPRKITKGVADIVKGKQKTLKMGYMDTYRDIGHAKDYVKAIYLMLQHSKPEDFIIATGEAVSIKQMLEYVCELAGLKYDDVYEMNEQFMRPSDVPYLKGNSAKARNLLDWKPEYDWKSLLKEMYEHDLEQT